MHDAHFHMTPALFESLKVHGMQGIANAQSIQEYSLLKELQKEYSFFISVGMHPWYASLKEWPGMKELLVSPEVSLIGEIGLDNVWCDTPMELQREIFERQLELASALHKPVILHTKGMEEEIALRIRKYPNTYLVHWYSSMEHLDQYIEQDCYFTIGPSVGLDEAVTRAAACVPENRLLIETDGIEAIRWVQEAYPTGLPTEDLHYQTLQRSIHQLAALRSQTPEEIENRLDTNLKNFLHVKERAAADPSAAGES